MSELEVAQRILCCTSDRDVLGLAQSGPLTRESIQKSFHARALQIHPDKAAAEASTAASNSAVASAFSKLVEARDRLLELLPLSQALWQQQQQQQQPSTFAPGEAQQGSYAVFQSGSMFPTHVSTPSHPSASAPHVAEGPVTLQPFTFSSSVKCNTFGCLRTLSAEEVQAEKHVCSHCRNKPRKCAMFGCMRMVAGDAYCSEHRPR